jgi:hypothetical protein
MNGDGDSIDNPQVIVSVFNEYFLSVAEKLSHKTMIVMMMMMMILVISRINILASLIVRRPTG